jgi:hypothetical protein
VRALARRGGWERVDAAFRDPPQRTAEILHPDRYLASSRAADEEELFTAWRLTDFVIADYEPLGEYDLQLFLAGSEELRPRAAELASTLVAGGRSRAPRPRARSSGSCSCATQRRRRPCSRPRTRPGPTTCARWPPDPRLISFRLEL